MTVVEWTEPWVSRRAEALPLDVATGYWLAGLTDGEGCFSISKTTKGGFRVEFILKLRADDLPMFEQLRGHLGFGAISTERRGGTRKPCVRFVTQTKRDCLRVTEIFDAFPLRSKKARDYAVWREAAIYWASSAMPVHWAPMAAWFDELRAGRAYRGAA